MCEFRKRGIFTVQICTSPFISLAKSQARAYKDPELPIVVIPHPLGGLTIDMVEVRANAALSQVIKLLEERVSK